MSKKIEKPTNDEVTAVNPLQELRDAIENVNLKYNEFINSIKLSYAKQVAEEENEKENNNG